VTKFREDHHSKSHTLLTGTKEDVPVLSILIVKFWWKSAWDQHIMLLSMC